MSLDELRTELGAIDRSILELVAKRQALASKIGEVKRAAGIPTRDFRQEKDVIERARAAAVTHGLTESFGEALMLLLIRSSLTVQEKEYVAAQATGNGKRVLVIGGHGNMGRWFARFLTSQGYAIEIADPAGPVEGYGYVANWHSSPLDHDLIVVSTPMSLSNEVLHGIAAKKPKGLVFDVASLKSPVRTGLAALKQAGVRVTSVHPMFGPNTELLSARHVIFVDLGNAEAVAEAKALFAPTMATLVDMDLEKHDHMIAYVLGLSHALNIAFFTALAESGAAAPQLAKLSSTTFDAQLDVATRVADESPHLYYEIQSLNDYGTESLSALLYAVERLRSVVRAGDLEGFTQLMERGRGYLAGRPTER